MGTTEVHYLSPLELPADTNCFSVTVTWEEGNGLAVSQSVSPSVSQSINGALTLLVGQQGHPACEKTGCWFVGDDNLTGDLHDL